MPEIRLIADDLTGALDTAVQFYAVAGSLPVHFATEGVGIGSGAVDLATRELGMEECALRMRQAAHFLQPADLAFKKIHSLLRGHWAAELASLLRFASWSHCVLAPAFPAQGRITINGYQRAFRPDGTLLLDRAIDEPLRQVGLVVEKVSQPDRIGHVPDRVYICDAATDADLQAIVAAGRALPERVLWCGTAGLAHALSGAPAPKPPIGGAVLAIIGSHHPVSLEQSNLLSGAKPGIRISLTGDSEVTAAAIRKVLCGGGFALLTPDVPEGVNEKTAATIIRARLGRLLPDLDPPPVLFASGGETLRSVCEILGVRCLRTEGEWLPGVPVSRIEGGTWDRTQVLSKSGAFGASDLLKCLFVSVRDQT